MVRIFLVCALAACQLLVAADKAVPKIDKQRLAVYLRYLEGYVSTVEMTIDDPTPSAYPGFSQVIVHLSLNGKKVGDRMYYVTSDGQHFLNGSLWDIQQNPFLDTLERLPMDGPSFGPANAKVTIVEFSDFECPFCREFAKTVRGSLAQKYPNDVRLIFENFPLENVHPWAIAAAEAGQCMANQNVQAFWAFHDWIFEHQQEVNADNLSEKTLDLGKEQHLDPAKLSTCLTTHATAKTVEDSLNAGRRLQIQQTPTLFINGRMIAGAVPWKDLDAVIQLELARPKEIPGPAACCEVTVPTVFRK